jgi:hypothetical protein
MQTVKNIKGADRYSEVSCHVYSYIIICMSQDAALLISTFTLKSLS